MDAAIGMIEVEGVAGIIVAAFATLTPKMKGRNNDRDTALEGEESRPELAVSNRSVLKSQDFGKRGQNYNGTQSVVVFRAAQERLRSLLQPCGEVAEDSSNL